MERKTLPMKDMIAFEQGRLNEEETITLFQRLIDDGSVWTLQGIYGRIAHQFLKAGVCHPSPTNQLDFYGNVVPGKTETDGESDD